MRATRRRGTTQAAAIRSVHQMAEGEKMGLFSSSSSSTTHHRSTTVRYVTVVALGFTVLVIMGVVRHSGLTEQHEPRASTLNPTKVNLGEGVVSDAVVDGDGRGGGAASEAASRRRQQSQQRGQEPRLEKEEAKYKTAPRAGAAAAAAAGAGAAGGGTPFPAFDGVNPAVYRYEVVNKFPHDPTAFTQGFLYSHPDTIFESTGSVGGPSTVREVSLTTGEVRRKTELDMAYFAEGLTMYKAKLAQITWRNNRGFFYDPATLAKTGEFATPLKDGWGLTGDAGDSDLLIVTDASKHLHFIDPGSDPMSLTKSTVVTDGDKVVRFANELETIGGEVWANVLERDCVVVGWIVMSDLKAKQDRAPGTRGVLNGIAYDAEGDRIFVTGKTWSNVFEIKLVETPQTESAAALDEARRVCWPADSLPAYGYP